MKTRKFAIAKQQKLLDECRDLAISRGARQTPDGYYQYELNTIYGVLGISFGTGVALCHIHTCFWDVKNIDLGVRNRLNIGLTGKMNFYFDRDQRSEDCLGLWKWAIDLVARCGRCDRLATDTVTTQHFGAERLCAECAAVVQADSQSIT